MNAESIDRFPEHPGYYWLDYKWENLYPSCTFCNQNRKDYPRYDDRRTLPSKGKMDQFPIENEEDRAMEPGDDLTKERPLLLDPCSHDPEKHLTFDIHGQVHAKEAGDRKAGETIRICHLKRRRLRDNRAHTIVRVVKLMETIALSRAAGNNDVEKGLKELLDDFIAPGSEYASAARAV